MINRLALKFGAKANQFEFVTNDQRTIDCGKLRQEIQVARQKSFTLV